YQWFGCARIGGSHRAVPNGTVPMETGPVRVGRSLHPPDGQYQGQFQIMKLFSPARLLGMIVKELIQMRRDRMTFAIMFGIPIVQMLLFGYAINSDPRHLPTAVLLADEGPEGRTLMQGLKNSTYFDFVRKVNTEEEAKRLLTHGEVQFVLNIPQN